MVALAVIALGAAPAGAAPRSANGTSGRVATIQRLISAVNAHRIAATSGLFTATATLDVAGQRWRQMSLRHLRSPGPKGAPLTPPSTIPPPPAAPPPPGVTPTIPT